MSYYDPKIYNKDALKYEDKRLIDAYDMAIEAAGNRDFIIEDMMDLAGDTSVLGQITREVAGKTIDAVLERLAFARQEMIVSIMDGYPEVAEDE